MRNDLSGIAAVVMALGLSFAAPAGAAEAPNAGAQEGYAGAPANQPGYGPGPGYGPAPGDTMAPSGGYYGYPSAPGMGPGNRFGPGPGPRMGRVAPGPGYDRAGALGFGPLGMLDLTDEQRSKLQTIHDTLRKRHWEMMGEMMDARVQLRKAMAEFKPDPETVGEVYGEIGRIHQQMAKEKVRAHNQIIDLLTERQRAQLENWHRRMGAGG